MFPSSYPVRLRDRNWGPQSHEAALHESRWEGIGEAGMGVMRTKRKRKTERKKGMGKGRVKQKGNGAVISVLNLPMDFRPELKDVPAPK